ncbi:MAG TPA: hypothetical protein VOB72_05600 [Candidatus Dormibacteraeota bacterium]|nr:hypothetical protein [Candidatus Dormibacteraeota bacterium]
MRTTATVLQMLVRLCGLVLIVLGILFWTGSALVLVPVHMLIGLLLVLSLWGLAFIAARSGAPVGQVAVAFVWGLIVPVLGVTQDQLITSGPHWLVQVLHLLVGLVAIGMAEGLGRRIRLAQSATA